MKIWAVATGRKVGVFTTWNDVISSIAGYRAPVFNEFTTHVEADAWIQKFKLRDALKSNVAVGGHEEAVDGHAGLKRSASDSDSDYVVGEGHTDKKHKKESSVHHVLYFDGACRNNGKPTSIAGAGFVIKDEGGVTVVSGTKYLGAGTNNIAEYAGLEAGLAAAVKAGFKNLIVRGDSELVIKQVNGEYKARNPNMLGCFMRVIHIIARFDTVKFEHIRRDLNSDADAMANRAIEEKKTQTYE